jgi:hypothetical protein
MDYSEAHLESLYRSKKESLPQTQGVHLQLLIDIQVILMSYPPSTCMILRCASCKWARILSKPVWAPL